MIVLRLLALEGGLQHDVCHLVPQLLLLGEQQPPSGPAVIRQVQQGFLPGNSLQIIPRCDDRKVR